MNQEKADQSTEGRVVVAMSGGVDSSVTAVMLHRQGLDVVGVSMRLYAEPAAEGRTCCTPDDLYDARLVASSSGFPFYVANYQEQFRERVIDHFVNEYRRGRTPSPCVMCNDHLKFDILLQRMRALGGSSLATGHYARIEERDGRHVLLRGADRTKDQSYFLFGLRRADLAVIRFPLGGLTKTEVRELGERLAVPTAEKPESQDICFIGKGDYADFVRQRLSAEDIRPGRIVRRSTAEVLGTHEGIHAFTAGQRRGLGLSYPEPLYVHGVDAETGDVFVGTREEVSETRFGVERCNWLRWNEPPSSFECEVQVRYRQKPLRGVVHPRADGTQASVELERGEPGIARGQAAVFYDGDEVVGGGWIEDVG
jgi:tRNA-specific 2-thiouridylase